MIRQPGILPKRGCTAILYLLLAGVGAGVFWAMLKRHKPWEVIAVATVAGVAVTTADFIAHATLHLYLYRPHLLEPLQADGPLGLILAEYIFLTGAATAMLGLPRHQRLWLGAGLTILVVLIEAWFVRLGLVIHNGWRLSFTAAGFLPYFWAVAWWTGVVEAGEYTGFRRTVTVFTAAGLSLSLWAVTNSLVLGRWAITPGLLTATFPDKAIGMWALYTLPAAVTSAVMVLREWALWPRGALAYAAGVAAWLSLLRSVGLLHHAAWWSPLGEALVLGALLLGLGMLDARLSRAPMRV